jgi:hypothetical protein
MPEISRFLGIIIKTGEIIAGRFPKSQSTIVTAWALIRKKELMDNWKALTTGKEAKKIDPLR